MKRATHTLAAVLAVIIGYRWAVASGDPTAVVLLVFAAYPIAFVAAHYALCGLRAAWYRFCRYMVVTGRA